jgi:fructokinase
MKPVICFGEALIDFLNTGSEKVDALTLLDYRQYPGGAPANAAVAVAKLGGNACFAGQVGNDMFGDFLISSLKAYGVDTRFVTKHPTAKTALAFVKLNQNGDRSFSFYRQDTADLLFTNTQVDSAWFEEQPLFHFCSNTLTNNDIAQCTAFAVDQAEQHGALISFDVNLRHNLWPAGQVDIDKVNQLVHRAHLLKFSREEIEFLAQGHLDTYITQCLNTTCRLIIITNGEYDIEYFTATGNGVIHPPKVTVMDTTAGGDAFVGGLLYGLSHFKQPKSLLDNLDVIAQLLQSAAACGAHAVTKPGAFPALPGKGESLQLPQPLDQMIEHLLETVGV